MQNGVNYSELPEQQSVTVDTGKLPAWPVLLAMQVAYSEAVVRLQNSLSLTEYGELSEFNYKMHVTNSTTGERRVVVQRGGEDSSEAATINWEVAISILAIIRLKDYTATYRESNTIGLYFSFEGDAGRKSDMDRLMLLFEERPEFSMMNLSHNLEEQTDAEGEKEG